MLRIPFKSMPRIIRAEYLSYYNSARNSDKLFNIFLILEDDGTFSCLTENGRRGSNLVRRTLCSKTGQATAESNFRQKLDDKRYHRETPYTAEPFGYNYSQVASEYSFNSEASSIILSPEIDNDNKSSTKSNVIVFPVEKTEKQVIKPKHNGIFNSEQFDSLEL